MHRLIAQSLAKRFGALAVFSDISFELQSGQSLAVVGPNGSGKSTLLMLLLGMYQPTRGAVVFKDGDALMDEDAIRRKSALVSPYLSLYDNLTAEENLVFLVTVSGGNVTGKRINELLSLVGLEGRGMDPVGSYSSGMKQRLKYAAALVKEPAFLFLDEPMSNLDDQGKQMVRDVIEQLRGQAVIVLGTNEQEDYGLADGICRVGR